MTISTHTKKILLFILVASLTLALLSAAIGTYLQHKHNGTIQRIKTVHSLSPNIAAIKATSDPQEKLAGFYSEYVKNKNSKTTQSDLVSVVATDSFTKKHLENSQLNPLVCGSEYPQSVSIQNEIVENGKKKYIVELQYDNNSVYKTAIIQVKTVGNQELIESATCPNMGIHHDLKKQK